MGHVLRIVYRKSRDPDRERVPPIRDERTGQWRCQYCFKPDFRNTNEVRLLKYFDYFSKITSKFFFLNS